MAGKIDPRVEKATQEFCHKYRRLREEIGKAIVGHTEIVDGVLMVVRAGRTPRQVVQNGLAQLHAINANVMGALLNRVDMNREGYYHYQYYYYYYGEEGNKKKKKRQPPPAEHSA